MTARGKTPSAKVSGGAPRFPVYKAMTDAFGFGAEVVSAYALEPMAWANACGILLGQDWGGLYPAGTAARAEIAAIVTRFCERFLK